jgi:opacity protein-like surface antigen
MHALRITTILALLATAGVAQAQDKRIEVVPFLGYTFSDGVNINPQPIGEGRVVDRLSPTSGFSWGANFDYFITEDFSLGFLFSQQDSNLEGRLQGSGKVNFTDMKVRNYHGIFSYNWGDEDSTLRPFFFGGLGATQYSPSDIEGQNVDSSTRFSTTWGGGVKYFVSESIGFRFMGRWTPTYIKSDPGGIWCSPWYPWSCWVLANPNYSNQGEFTAGVVLRF